LALRLPPRAAQDVRIKDVRSAIKDLADPLALGDKAEAARLNEEADQHDYAGSRPTPALPPPSPLVLSGHAASLTPY